MRELIRFFGIVGLAWTFAAWMCMPEFHPAQVLTAAELNSAFNNVVEISVGFAISFFAATVNPATQPNSKERL